MKNMKTFNLIANENGKIIKTIKAVSQSKAQENFEKQGYDCIDDNFIESQKETDNHNRLPGRTIYIDKER